MGGVRAAGEALRGSQWICALVWVTHVGVLFDSYQSSHAGQVGGVRTAGDGLADRSPCICVCMHACGTHAAPDWSSHADSCWALLSPPWLPSDHPAPSPEWRHCRFGQLTPVPLSSPWCGRLSSSLRACRAPTRLADHQENTLCRGPGDVCCARLPAQERQQPASHICSPPWLHAL